MKTFEYAAVKICILDDNDRMKDCPFGAYAIIEDCGFYVVLLVTGDDAWAIHHLPVLTLEDALDIIAERHGLFACPPPTNAAG